MATPGRRTKERKIAKLNVLFVNMAPSQLPLVDLIYCNFLKLVRPPHQPASRPAWASQAPLRRRPKEECSIQFIFATSRSSYLFSQVDCSGGIAHKKNNTDS